MSIGESLSLLLLVVVCLIAVMDWRRAVYLGILADVLRDPVRKLTAEQPVRITLAGAGVWLVILCIATTKSHRLRHRFFRAYPSIKAAFAFLIIAIIPPFIVSCIAFDRGWLMASIGGASYLIPSIGVFTGFAFLRSAADGIRLMKWYVLVNSIMLLSVPMEYLDWEVAGLGGIQYTWIRYREGYTVDLISGWYRSPDVMGLHAAHVVMFSLIIAARSGRLGRIGWLSAVLWAGFCVLLSGRRKMIGVPLVFVAAFLALGTYFHATRVSRLATLSLLALFLGGAAVVLFWSPEQSFEYTEFASSIFTEGISRSNELIVGSTIGTLQQVGLLGRGLGTATQGRYYSSVDDSKFRGWQEDGISRLFMELGVPGVLLICIALIGILKSIVSAVSRMSPKSEEILLQVGLVSVVIGDAASFMISHQQFSGDPVNALIVTLIIGMILRIPLSIQNSPPARFPPGPSSVGSSRR